MTGCKYTWGVKGTLRFGWRLARQTRQTSFEPHSGRSWPVSNHGVPRFLSCAPAKGQTSAAGQKKCRRPETTLAESMFGLFGASQIVRPSQHTKPDAPTQRNWKENQQFWRGSGGSTRLCPPGSTLAPTSQGKMMTNHKMWWYPLLDKSI